MNFLNLTHPSCKTLGQTSSELHVVEPYEHQKLHTLRKIVWNEISVDKHQPKNSDLVLAAKPTSPLKKLPIV
jgi:hypothetical protein